MAENNLDTYYKLRCTILGHSMDVRALTVTPQSQIITCSRDQTSKLWCEDPQNNNSYQEEICYRGHAGYVTSVCHIPSLDSTASGFIATGSRDCSILIFALHMTEPKHVLTGHSDTVSCIAWKKDILVSGSWDHTLKVWKDWVCISDLEGHTGPVWSVAIIEGEDPAEPSIISASADKTLKLWKGGKNIMTYHGHTDCVRGLALYGANLFLSCANDASIRLWKVSGECLATYFGHTNFIYSVYPFSNFKGFITCGEDRTVRVWNSDGENTQTIHLPAHSVWSVAILPNCDIIAGSSDGACRVFTRSNDRKASEEEIKEFDESLAKFKLAVEDIGGIKKSDLPDKSFLLVPGKRDGQNIMIKDGDQVLCYNWSAAKEEWVSVGEVVGGSGGSAISSGKVLYEGREYDFVFDVDLDEEKALKLPYNTGEDPWTVAQAFIHLHDLPQAYLDEVANFITKNANVSINSLQQSDYSDPFTGGSRYIPSSDVTFGGHSDPSDPFTGSGRYVPNSSSTGPAVDDFSSPFFPQRIPLLFESINKDGICSKFKESNGLVSEKLANEQIEHIVNAVTSSNQNVAVLAPLEVALQWPPERVWPVLDVLRLAVLSPEVQEMWITGEKGDALVGLLVGFLRSSSPAATLLLSLRSLSNFASHPPGQKVLMNSASTVVGAVSHLAPYENKNLEIAAATLVINLSVILRDSGKLEDECEVLSAAATLVISVKDGEALFRSLVAIGTLISQGETMKSLSNSMDLKTLLQGHAVNSHPQKVKECTRHILQMLQ